MDKYKTKTLLLLGDSIMYGSGNGGTGVGEYLSNDLGFNLKKYCIGGARVGFDEGKDWIVNQLKKAVADNIKPDLIIFDGFTNDCNMTDGKNCDVEFGELSESVKDVFELTESDSFTTCFQGIAAGLKKYFPNSEYLFIRPHKMGRRDAVKQIEYGERAVEICKKEGIHVVDLFKESGLDTFDAGDRDRYTNDSYGWGRGDCTHPNALCYKEKYMPLIERAIGEIL